MSSADRRAAAEPGNPPETTLAQRFAVAFGAVLVLVGLLGFIADASFDTGSDVEGGSFLGFEVNGWHNLVHLFSGVGFLVASRLAPVARAYALAFGVVYLAVTFWGLSTDSHVAGLLPVNLADNVLHTLLGISAVIIGILSRTDRPGARRSESRVKSAGA